MRYPCSPKRPSELESAERSVSRYAWNRLTELADSLVSCLASVVLRQNLFDLKLVLNRMNYSKKRISLHICENNSEFFYFGFPV